MTKCNAIRVTAILPNFNDAVLLPKALDSLLKQTVPFDEIIVVDDGSTDDSVHIVNRYRAAHPNLYLIQHDKNRGVSAALNTGLQQASGDFVILCAADDWYADNLVAEVKPIMQSHPHIGIVCGDAIVSRFDLPQPFKRTLPFQPANQVISPQQMQVAATQSYVGFNGGGGMFLNRQAVVNAHCLQNKLRWHCDWLLYFVVAFRCGIYYRDRVFVHINMRRASYSEGKRKWQIQKQVIIDTVTLIQNNYADVYSAFKNAGLLPHYSLAYLPLFCFVKNLRAYGSISLLWKLCLNNAMVVRIGRMFPYRIILRMRKLLRA